MGFKANFVPCLIALYLNVYFAQSQCPAPELLAPCKCQLMYRTETFITCDDYFGTELEIIFNTLSTSLPKDKKEFNSFYLFDTSIAELKDNTFKDIAFQSINIINAKSLKKISPLAFNGTNLVTKSISLVNNEMLEEPVTIFEALRSFTNATSINLYFTGLGITEIPADAFKSSTGHKQDKLTRLSIGGKAINTLGNKAFSTLNSLEKLKIYDTSIDFITGDAFRFDNGSRSHLTIDLADNPLLKEWSFAPNSLSNTKRATTIKLGDSIKYLDKHTFLPFLAADSHNRIDLLNKPIDCEDCNNNWLRMFNTTQLTSIKCTSGQLLNDPVTVNRC